MSPSVQRILSSESLRGELKKACGSGMESGNGLPFVKIEYHSPP